MNSCKYLQKRFALSEKGAQSFVGGIFASLLLNLALMLPVMFIFLFLTDYLQPVVRPGSIPANGFWFYALTAAAFMAIIYVVAMFQYKNTYTNVYVESANRRIALAEKLRRLPLSFFGEKNLSDLTSTVMEDNNMIEMLFSHAVPQLFASVGSIVLVAAGLFLYDWRLSLALFWVVPVAAAVVLYAKQLLDKANRDFYYVKRGVTERIQEGLECIQEIKAYNGEDKYNEQLDEQLDVYEESLRYGELLGARLIGSSYSILKLGLATVILAGAYLLSTGSTTMFTYLIFLMVAASIYNPIMDVFNNIAALTILDVRIGRMREMEEMPAQQGREECNNDGYDIVFEHVDFAYETGKQVLRDVSFTAKQGEVTALIGPSGSGKTTLAKLAARFWDVRKGRILLGGEDIGRIDPETLLKNYAIVFQDVVLFNATVRDNIRIGKMGATDEEIARAAHIARCDEFISRMPEGMDTVIGENGERLSGGERQRISIARAVLKDAPVILMDEATASLDVENESLIQEALSALIREKTVVIIAHRMRTIRGTDKIVLLNEGRVEAIGTDKELQESSEVYRKMLERSAN
ncbi:ABC transporter ATP-binding protein [Phocaeicola abscessus]|uniref:ABC transporter ATP-binding protein n=1 Tax=Phocaeicola abscessus TaxID=555313 RepID=UPI0028E8C05D|nr:ABC transporter ATP-binding protein [Phocaeicola abscessus]